MTASWTTTVDRAAAYVPTAADWNSYMGALGNLTFLFNRSWLLQGITTTEATTTSTVSVDVLTVSGLNIATNQPIMIIGSFRKTATNASPIWLGLKVNTTTIFEGPRLAYSSSNLQAEDGTFVCIISPRSSSYTAGVVGMFNTRVSTTGAVGQTAAVTPDSNAWAAIIPEEVITSIIIRGVNSGSNNNLAIKDVSVYAGGATP